MGENYKKMSVVDREGNEKDINFVMDCPISQQDVVALKNGQWVSSLNFDVVTGQFTKTEIRMK